MKINAKENALRIIRFDEPERVVGVPPKHIIGYRGCNHEGYLEGGHHLPVGSKWVDIWGTMWKKEHEGVMGFPVGHPLADLPGALKDYDWPSANDERIYGRIYELAEGWDRENTFLSGAHRDPLWEKSYMLVGMEDIMCYFFTEPGAVKEVLHRIMDFQLGIAEHYLKLGVEMIGLGDDLGTQNGLLLSRGIIEEFLLPEYRRLFELYKSHDVLINFHSCGHIEPVLEMFMELGIDTLNPIQATANNLESVRERTNGRMALQGGISSSLVMSGPVEEIRREVGKCIWQLGRDGGYFCGPDQSMPYPDEHVEAVRDAVEEFGCYPLRR